MENKIAVVAIIVTDTSAVERINALLHDFGEYIIGRMGIPVSTLSIAIPTEMPTPIESASPIAFWDTEPFVISSTCFFNE